MRFEFLQRTLGDAQVLNEGLGIFPSMPFCNIGRYRAG
jgi:hypothetical protein